MRKSFLDAVLFALILFRNVEKSDKSYVFHIFNKPVLIKFIIKND